MLYFCLVSEVTKLSPGAVTLGTPQVQTVASASRHVNSFPLFNDRENLLANLGGSGGHESLAQRGGWGRGHGQAFVL